ncbi:MAG: PorT family protein [Bacteroides sp.]|nr:PorT family protein [Bacteroides sp.]
MKRFKVLIVAAIVAIASVVPVSAQFKIGPRLGVNVSTLKFDSSVFDSENRAGFTGGVMCEFTAPIIGVGFDLSAMYVRRAAKWMESNDVVSNNRDYFSVPLNFKWKFGIPLVKPFLTTGPEVSFLTSRKAVSNAFSNGSVDWSWNFGAGVEVLSHLQVAASYGIGINKAMKAVNIGGQNVGKGDVSARNRVWTITAAYLF